MARRVLRVMLSIAVVLVAATSTHGDIEKDPDRDPRKAADIRKLLEVTDSQKIAIQFMERILESLKTLAPDVPEKFWDEFKSMADSDEYTEGIVTIYDRHFTHDEIKELLAFYETQLGRKLIEKLPVIVRESMEFGEEWGQVTTERILKKLEAEGYY